MASYKLRKVANGACFFALVDVDLEECPQACNVTLDIDPTKMHPDDYKVPSWYAAAVEGAERALRWVKAAGLVSTYRKVTVRAVRGTMVDTTDAAVRCAAGLAVFQALCPDRPLPKIQCVDKDLTIREFDHE